MRSESDTHSGQGRHAWAAGRAWPAAVSVLTVAYTNYSLVGLTLLMAFFAWGLMYLGSVLAPTAKQLKQSLWGLVSAVATALLIAQIVVQSIYKAGNAGWATDDHTKRVLQLFGLNRAESVARLMLVIAAPALALLASTRELRKAPGAAQRSVPDPQPDLQRASMHSAWSYISDSTRSGCSNTGVAGAVGICLAALSWPSLLALPYQLILVAAVLLWCRGSKASTPAKTLRVCQVYTGIHILVLYVWQIRIIRRAMWQGTTDWLGLYELSQREPVHLLICKITQLIGLHMVFSAAGFLAASKEAGLHPSDDNLAWHQPHASPLDTFATLWHYNQRNQRERGGLHEPLLGEGDPYGQPTPQPASSAAAGTPIPHQTGVERSSLARLLLLVIPFSAEGLVEAFEWSCRGGTVPALALVGFALLQPSLLSSVALLVGLSSLLTTRASRPRVLTPLSPYLCAAVLLWQLACYLTTALAPVVHVPAIAQSLGLRVYAPGILSLGYLLAQLGVAMSLAALAKSTLNREEPDWYNSSAAGPASRRRADLPGFLANASYNGRQQQQTDAAFSNAASPDPTESAPHELRTVRTGRHQAAPPQRKTASLDFEADDYAPQSSVEHMAEAGSPRVSPWPALQLELGRAVYYCGFLLLPCILFWVGLSQQDLSHGLYLALLLLQLLPSSLSLEPSIKAGTVTKCQHWLVRSFATGHLLLMYAAVVSWLPGLPSSLHPPGARAGLQLAGLWHPSLAASMLPVFTLLVLGTFLADLGSWLQQQQSSRGITLLANPTAHPPLILQFGRASVSFGALAVVLAAYVLVLWATRVGLLGLAYVALLIWVFTHPPIRGRWGSLDEGGVQVSQQSRPHSGERTANSMKGSSQLRWLPLSALALFASLDGLTQYTLAATPAASALHVSEKLGHFLTAVVGFSMDANEPRLAECLMRSFLLLGLLRLYRFGFAVGTAQAHDESATLESGSAAQEGFVPLVKRGFILHSSKLLGLAVFWAAMSQPGAIGWLLTLGLVCLGPLLGRSATTRPHQQRLLLTAMLLLDAIIGFWILAQYAFEVTWLRQLLGNSDSLASKFTVWAGIKDVPPHARPLEAVLRSKCIVLLAVTMKRRAVRWLRNMPREVTEAGGPGSPCCLFWPPAGAHSQDSSSQRGGVWQQVASNSFVHYVALAAQDARLSFNRNLTRALRAVDWPESRPHHQSKHHTSNTQHDGHAASDSQGTQLQHGQGTAVEPTSGLPQSHHTEARKSWQQQMRPFQLAAIDQTERLWQNWGLEITMGSLLVAAFLATNVISLVYMLFIAVGMAAKPAWRRPAWRFAVVPLLGLLLILQYAVFIWPPPFMPGFRFLSRQPQPSHTPNTWSIVAGHLKGHHHKHSHQHEEHQTFEAWLGLAYVDVSALWALFLAFAACAVQVHYDIWRHPADSQSRNATANPSLAERLLPQSIQDAYADGRANLAARVNAAAQDEGSAGVAPSEAIWMPMEYAAQSSWRWLDWARFYFYRHYSDAVLIAVIALCALENDVIHAGYLALALYFFRFRERLRSPSLFRWLTIYNFAVMLLTLAYQAPIQNIWHGTPHRKGCNVAHVLGLYKMTGRPGLAFELTAAGSVADVALWGIARLQTRMYASETFQRAMQVVAEEQAADAQAAAQHKDALKQVQVRKALEASRLRAERASRVTKLKAGVSRSGGSFGVNSALLELDNEANDRESERKLLGDSTAGSDLSDDESGEEHQLAGGTLAGHLIAQSAGAMATAVSAASEAVQPAEPGQHPVDQGHNRQRRHKQAGMRGFTWALKLMQRIDEESWTCYVLFVLIFVLDVSLLTMVFPVSLAVYSLLTQRPRAVYWQACLVYLEGILIAQYLFQIPTHLHCRAVSRSTEAYASIVGLHRSILSAIPLFVVYLATLVHVYALSRQQVQSTTTANAPSTASLGQDLESGHSSAHPDAAPSPAEASSMFSRGRQGLFQGWQAFKGFLLAVCSARERPLHFIKVEFAGPQGSRISNPSKEEAAAKLRESVQAILDDYRNQDVAAALARLQASSTQHQERQQVSSESTAPMTEASFDDPPLSHVDLSRVGPMQVLLQEVVDEGNSGFLAALLQVIPERPPGPYHAALPMPVRSLRPAQDAASALLRYKQDHPESQSNLEETAGDAEPDASSHGNISGNMQSALHQASAGNQQGTVNSGLDCNSSSSQASTAADDAVSPSRAATSTREDAETSSTVQAAAATNSHDKTQEEAGTQAAVRSGSASDSSTLQLGTIEPHWRTETDYYAATVALDFLAFVFVALFYQSVVSSAQSLADITDERVVPVDYLGILMLLFLFMVLDRLFYTLGLHVGKALLLWVQMALVYYYTFSLFWSPFTSKAAHNQLRLLLLLKTASFALSALQLRSGYPPRASFKGAGGRHAFIFMRHVNTWGYLGLQIFCGLPFIYELRAVLDWSCTPTTLKLFDWLKLEDISTSLYFVTCDRYGREGRQLGQRQPRYMKFCQGALLFTLLLVLLWVPLIVFSSGNPTYKVPGVDGFGLNVSIGSMTSSPQSDFQAKMTFPLFVGGEQQVQGKWVGSGSLPAGMTDQYTDDQLQLLCISEDADRLWKLTPPAQKALSALLDDSSAAMSFSWSVLRDAPPLSPHGSPMCQATKTFPLAPQSRQHLAEILQGRRDTAALKVANATDPDGLTSHGLYSLFWQLRGDTCAVRTDFRYQSPGWGKSSVQETWQDQFVGCNISLAASNSNAAWWQLHCQVLDRQDKPIDNSLKGWATCGEHCFSGPRLVAVLERVQTGFLGQTLSSFGITGLYITFVFGIGRFLRLAATNIRMRIMYEDLPTTKRLIALCQDIYIARAQGELALEEELYWALINIYRSPAVMFELTKKKEQ